MSDLVRGFDGQTLDPAGYLTLGGWRAITRGLTLTPEQFSQLCECLSPEHQPYSCGPDEFMVPVPVKIARPIKIDRPQAAKRVSPT